MGNGSRLNETKETWQSNAMQDSGLALGPPRKIAIKEFSEHFLMFEIVSKQKVTLQNTCIRMLNIYSKNIANTLLFLPKLFFKILLKHL